LAGGFLLKHTIVPIKPQVPDGKGKEYSPRQQLHFGNFFTSAVDF